MLTGCDRHDEFQVCQNGMQVVAISHHICNAYDVHCAYRAHHMCHHHWYFPYPPSPMRTCSSSGAEQQNKCAHKKVIKLIGKLSQMCGAQCIVGVHMNTCKIYCEARWKPFFGGTHWNTTCSSMGESCWHKKAGVLVTGALSFAAGHGTMLPSQQCVHLSSMHCRDETSLKQLDSMA